MKRIFTILLLGYVTMSFSSNSLVVKTISKEEITQPREQAIRAHVQMRNEWISGYVYVSNGVVTRCQFEDVRAAGNVVLQAHIYEPTRASYLNPNNPIAIQNNFTHTVDIPNYGRAYFNM